MIFHENRLLANDSHEISYLFFFRKLGKMTQTLSSAAVEGLVNSLHAGLFFDDFCHLLFFSKIKL